MDLRSAGRTGESQTGPTSEAGQWKPCQNQNQKQKQQQNQSLQRHGTCVREPRGGTSVHSAAPPPPNTAFQSKS